MAEPATTKLMDPWRLFDIEEQRKSLTPGEIAYSEFLRIPSLHCGLYQLPKGSLDMQNTHEEDEVYYVLEGTAQIRLGGEGDPEVRDVGPGMVLHVQASQPHSFFEIEEDMLLLVMLTA